LAAKIILAAKVIPVWCSDEGKKWWMGGNVYVWNIVEIWVETD
jgi:hypothetical protein